MPAPDFERHFRQSPLTDAWEPLYSRVTDEAVTIGLDTDTQHCNSRGFVHGGLISALADNAMGLSCKQQHEGIAGLVTISLHLDFVRAAQKKQWLQFETTYVKLGRSIDIAQAHITADGKVCALAGATFRVLDR